MSQLTDCKACGHQIAKTAKLCPSCGAKNRYVDPNVQLAAVILLGGAMLYSWISDMIPDAPKPPLSAAEQQARTDRNAKWEARYKREKEKAAAQVDCGRILERSLRNPDSLEWDRRKSAETLTDAGWLILRRYSAENLYGGRRVGVITCQFDRDNKLIDHAIAER